MKSMRMFVYACKGLKAAWKAERNLRLHAAATVAVLGCAGYYQVTVAEWCILLLCIGGVWVAELLNTAIEKLTDAVFPQQHPKAAFIKDVAAAAVLLMCLVAAICGVLIFVNYFSATK